jgi:hypothetical protein
MEDAQVLLKSRHGMLNGVGSESLNFQAEDHSWYACALYAGGCEGGNHRNCTNADKGAAVARGWDCAWFLSAWGSNVSPAVCYIMI